MSPLSLKPKKAPRCAGDDMREVLATVRNINTRLDALIAQKQGQITGKGTSAEKDYAAVRRELWNHMASTHDIHLLESELNDIVELSLRVHDAEVLAQITRSLAKMAEKQ